MKTCKSVTFVSASKLCIAFFLAAAMQTALGQINTNDPSLVLWLKADTLTGSTQDQTDTNVPTAPVWTSSDSYGTIFAVPPINCNYDFNDQSNHTPQLITVTNNGLAFQTLWFREENDPVTVSNHMADRLWQTNNLGTNFTGTADPLDIDVTNDFTVICVYDHLGFAGPYGTIFAQRSSYASPYDLFAGQADFNHGYVTYAGSVVYALGNPIPLQPDGSFGWGIVEWNLTAGGTLTMREYYRSTEGWQTYTETNVPRNEFNPGDPDTIDCHTQGATPPCDVLGGGASERCSMYLAEIAMYNRSLSSNELAGIENHLLAKYFLQPGPPQITDQPQSQSVNVFEPVTFTVLPDGSPPFTYQWRKNGSPIQGANTSSYSITSATTNDSGAYSVMVSNSIGFIASTNAILTVITPTNPPTVLSALIDYTNNSTVTVNFSELMSPQTATNAANYSINNGVTVSGVTAVTNAANTNYITSVALATSPITTKSILTVNGSQDQFGNAATNSQAVILVPAAVGTPPTANLLLWLAADKAVFADSIGVYEWDDQSGTANDHNAFPAFGNVQVGQVASPNAMHPALNFDGTDALVVDNTADFNLQTFTIYLVGDLDNTKLSDDFLGNWPGFVLGGSDGTPGALKWATWGSGSVYQAIDPSPRLGNRVPTLIVGAFSNPGNETLALNGSQVAIVANTLPIDYSTARGLAIGALFPTTTQNLIGDIEEILIYSNVSAAQDAAVETYLAGKYFSPSLTVPTLVSATLNATNNGSVAVVFSEPVSAATATNGSNYAIDQGVTVSAAAVVNQTTVTLTTSAINPGPTYTLTVNGVSDWAGNAIATNSQINITGIPAPRINISGPAADGTITISWNGTTATLQSADVITGPWSDITGATSPYAVTPSQAQKFYRLKQ